MTNGRKQIAFDLDTKMVKEYYPTENWQNAYRDIKRIMTANGFSWQQGSVYTSNQRVSSAYATKVVEEISKKLPWTNRCMRDCVITNIGQSFSQNHVFDKNADIQPREKAAEEDKVMDIVTDVVFSRAAYFESDEIEDEIER